jgi:exosortase
MITFSNIKEASAKRYLTFGGWVILSSLVFIQPLIALGRLSLSNADASHIVLIPFISGWLFFVERRKIFLNTSYDRILGSIVSLIAISVGLVTYFAPALRPDVQLSGYILSLVLFWVAGFAFTVGRSVWRTGRFPLLFLLLMVPWPSFLLDRVIYILQAGSAWITSVLFDLAGVPALREGFVFYLPSVTIEVAKECSGIRSSMAVLILALLIVHFGLKSFWKKALFLASALFVMILKNGIRIASLTLLSMYVDPDFLYGRLHHEGGVVFFLLGLLLLTPILWFLRRLEGLPPLKKQVLLEEQSAR